MQKSYFLISGPSPGQAKQDNVLTKKNIHVPLCATFPMTNKLNTRMNLKNCQDKL